MIDLRNRNKNDIYCSLVMTLIGAVGIINTFMSTGWSKATGEATKMFPRLISALLIVVAVFLLARTLFGKNQAQQSENSPVRLWHIIVFLAVGFISFEIVVRVGPAVGILICLLVLINLFDAEPKKHIVANSIYAIIATAVLIVIFTKVLPIVTISKILF